MTSPAHPTLIAPSKLRIIAFLILCAVALALGFWLRSAETGDPALMEKLQESRTARVFLVAEYLVLMAGVVLWCAVAFSSRFAARVARRAPSSFRVPVSPVLVVALILVTLPAVAGLSGLFPHDIFYPAILICLSFAVIILVLCRRLRKSGVHPDSVFALGTLSNMRAGLSTGAVTFVLLKPIMFVVSVGLLAYAQRVDLKFEQQRLVKGFLQYTPGPKLLFLLLTTVLIVPILEEVLFRGFLFGSLRRFVRTAGAVVLSAVLFAFLHFAPWQIANLFVLALFLALIHEKTQTLYSPIVLHVLINAEMVCVILLTR